MSYLLKVQRKVWRRVSTKYCSHSDLSVPQLQSLLVQSEQANEEKALTLIASISHIHAHECTAYILLYVCMYIYIYMASSWQLLQEVSKVSHKPTAGHLSQANVERRVNTSEWPWLMHTCAFVCVCVWQLLEIYLI